MAMEKTSLIDRIAHDPAYYAIRLFVLGVCLLLVVAAVYGQTEFQVRCENGYCTMREVDLDRLQQIINAMVNRIQELQAKTGCT